MQWNVLMKKELTTNSYTVQLTLQTQTVTPIIIQGLMTDRAVNTLHIHYKIIQLVLYKEINDVDCEAHRRHIMYTV